MGAQEERVKRILAGRVFDPYTLGFHENQLITVSEDSGLILDVRPFTENDWEDIQRRHARDKSIVDLRGQTVLPGFVDAHVHFFLHPYSETSWDDQLTKESLAERTVRATLHARRTLLAGYTAVRDLGTEGAQDADVGLRKCISGPDALAPGPRYFCVTRAIVPTGAYGPKGAVYPNKEGIDGITGAEVADGRDQCRTAVRRQIGAGADQVKIYANYRFRSRAIQVSKKQGAASTSTFSQDELEELISTASLYDVKVAAHATERDTIARLQRLGVHSIEHGFNILGDAATEEDPAERERSMIITLGLDDRGRFGVSPHRYRTPMIWVPTLSVIYTAYPDSFAQHPGVKAFQTALRLGYEHIACGGDTGVFAHGDNALEMKLMVRLGADWRQVLQWGTLGGWKCLRSLAWEGPEGERRLKAVENGTEVADPREVGDNEVPFGAIRKGWAADIIATTGNLEEDFEDAVSKERILFVMKGGRIFKQNGAEVPWP
ncbi:hypothetical protein OE88DRAFT_1730336 [Heliocybe sulcata]|uniref:Amidohydrolase-related domain-containing protein n=1 Tax=Heliocybe sulcata TaxID=5364 RepID=A0A5C3NT30_9AGAM|nr:hypothetical protein OE88DRAFT_1730336 [Heliocybe sulcata]